jgi:four helix bundle protein
MNEIQNQKNSKPYDLEERTFKFARECRFLIKQLPKTMGNFEDGKQLIRSSGSVHANFIEAVEAISKKDSIHRIKICRKEAKESRAWLRLIDVLSEYDRNILAVEATELMKIFGSIISKKENGN